MHNELSITITILKNSNFANQVLWISKLGHVSGDQIWINKSSCCFTYHNWAVKLKFVNTRKGDRAKQPGREE
jgi:hypothetical protein